MCYHFIKNKQCLYCIEDTNENFPKGVLVHPVYLKLKYFMEITLYDRKYAIDTHYNKPPKVSSNQKQMKIFPSLYVS